MKAYDIAAPANLTDLIQRLKETAVNDQLDPPAKRVRAEMLLMAMVKALTYADAEKYEELYKALVACGVTVGAGE